MNIPAATLFSLIAFWISVASIGVYFVMGFTTWWHRRFAVVAVLQLAMAAACWTLSWTHSLVALFLAFGVIGTNAYVAFFIGVYHSVANPARSRGRTAFNESLVGLGAFTGSIVCGWLAVSTSIETVFTWAPLVVLIFLSAELFLLRGGLRFL